MGQGFGEYNSPFDNVEDTVDDKNARLDALRKELASEVKDKLNGDYFWARDFFKLAEKASTGEDPVAAFKLMDIISGDGKHDDEIRELVGSDTKAVSDFVGSVLSDDSDDSTEAPSLGK